ncbi:MAG TPA: T9SS type A sorting domain-containing protein, partial [Saprospiraceae bacterium]|nr:T9SS type A sorting domain-containing protein [Saprospiraceae bacterium]
CQYNSATGYGLWSYTQVIKVHDKDAPEFTNCPQQPVTLCVQDEGVRLPATNQAFLGENDPNSSSCSVHVTMKQHIREACAGKVKYDVKVYPFNGNDFLQVVPETEVVLDDNHEGDLIFNTEESAIQSIRRDGLPYNSQWCGDYHRILWNVEDGCGNRSTCQYLFRLEDCKQPSPVCIQGLSTVVMPIGCQVTLWAKDFNASSFDDCTPSADLLYSFSGDSYQPSQNFNSTNIPAYGVELSIPIWVADGGTDDNCDGVISWNERNKDYCTTTIVFTDNSGNCDNSGDILYEGEILTDHQDPVEAVKVKLENNNQIVYAMTTADNGKYVLVVPQIDGQRYNIIPERLDQPRNGVSTLDLVRIQKHLLAKELFDSPYQYIAADANNNAQVSAIDLVEIRKLILGIYSEFPNNKSWRFVDKNYQFADVTHPWPFEEAINIQYDGNSVSGLDFVGVKVGDVNNTVQANALAVHPRNANRVVAVKTNLDQHVEAGQTVEVPFTIPEKVEGFQWTFETKGLDYLDVRSDDIEIGSQNTGNSAQGVIAISWNDSEFNATSEPASLTITLRFTATQSGELSDMIRMTNKIARAEAYTPEEETVDLRLEDRSVIVSGEFALYQNEPNPWTGSTMISFDLPEAGKVTLSLFDVTGKLVKSIAGEFKAGRQSIMLQKKDIPASGVLYYRLDSGNYSATKKMIRME